MRHTALLLLTLILTALTASAQATLSISFPNPSSPGFSAPGAGYWESRNTAEPMKGIAAGYSSSLFTVQGGFDLESKKNGFVLAGPKVIDITARFGDSLSVIMPLYALVGVTEFKTGLFDWGAASGLHLKWRRFGIGTQVNMTRYTRTISISIHI